MNVQVRLTRGELNIRARRVRREGRADHVTPRASLQPAPVPPRKRGGPSQDRALYHCHCGYVFEALVSTSVGCPHCGGKQAW